MSKPVNRTTVDHAHAVWPDFWEVVPASDYDALAQRCQELEMHSLDVGVYWSSEADTLVSAIRNKLGPALRLGHHAILEQAVTDVLNLLEAACAGTIGNTPEA